MTQGNRSVAELGDDIGRQLTSFVSLLEIFYTQDPELADVLADDFSNKLRDSYQKLFVQMTATISEELAKEPSKRMKPKKKRGRRPKAAMDASVDTTDISNSGVGVEELEANPQSLLQNLSDGEDVDVMLGNALQRGGLTDRAGGSRTSSWDTDNPTMKRID